MDTMTLDYDEKRELAERVAAAVRSGRWAAKVVEARVLVSRKLSGGWQQMGEIAIADDGSRIYRLTRNEAGVRDHVEAAIAA